MFKLEIMVSGRGRSHVSSAINGTGRIAGLVDSSTTQKLRHNFGRATLLIGKASCYDKAIAAREPNKWEAVCDSKMSQSGDCAKPH